MTEGTDPAKTQPENQADLPQGMSQEELEQQGGEELPDREAMSLINANLAAPINAAVAANVLSDNSIAYADAEQTNDITQINP
jgi:hypothetical protein